MSTTEDTSSSGAAETSSGIPEAIFVEDVDEFMKKQENNESAENVLKRLEEQHNKYKFMEYNITTKKNRLKTQVPDIKASLDIVKYMKSKKESAAAINTQFLLSDQLFVKAEVPPSEKVCLWLGANVMLEYNIDDAEALLKKNLNAAHTSLEQVNEDLSFLRDQTTTVEVNMARVYNWDVKKRQAIKGEP